MDLGSEGRNFCEKSGDSIQQEDNLPSGAQSRGRQGCGGNDRDARASALREGRREGLGNREFGEGLTWR